MRRPLCLAAALLPAVLLLTAASRAAPVTSLTVTFRQADGSPLAGAKVDVYYNEPSLAAHTDPVLATGTTSADGRFSAALDTSSLPAADSASVQGQQVFNAIIVAGSPAARQGAVQYAALPLGRADAIPAITAAVHPGAFARSRGDAVPGPLHVSAVHNSTYRYITVDAMNAADGIQTDLLYTYTSTVGRQTTVDVAVSYDSDTGPWSVGGSVTELTNRTIFAPWRHWNSYHQYVFANYYWVKVYNNNAFESWWSWEADHFAGQVSDYDPNIWHNGSVIGRLRYTVPAFTSCGGNCWFIMNAANSGWGRSSGTRATYRFEMAVADWIGMSDWATFGSITQQKWYYLRSGCGGRYSRVIWGDDLDPGTARIVQSDCMPTP